MRLFVGLDIPDAIRENLARYMEDLRRAAPGVRWVRPESLHLTLKFIGEFDEARLEELQRALAAVGGQPFDVSFGGVGFFTPRSPRVFWVGVDAGYELPALARAVDQAAVSLGVPAEEREFNPHLTLARSGSGRPQGSPKDRDKPKMYELRALVEGKEPPRFGTMTAREFCLYESKLSPGGAQYAKLARFRLES